MRAVVRRVIQRGADTPASLQRSTRSRTVRNRNISLKSNTLIASVAKELFQSHCSLKRFYSGVRVPLIPPSDIKTVTSHIRFVSKFRFHESLIGKSAPKYFFVALSYQRSFLAGSQAAAHERVLGNVLSEQQEQLVKEELVFLNSLLSTLQSFDAHKEDVEVRAA